MTITPTVPATSSEFAAGLLLVVWIGAILAGLAASVQQTSVVAKLHDEVRDLERRTGPIKSSQSSADDTRSGTGASPLFAALYADKRPSLWAEISSRPALAVTLLAAVLGIAGGGLLVAETAKVRVLALAQRQELTDVRAAHDSLATLVRHLRDSLMVTASHVAAAPAVLQHTERRAPTAHPAKKRQALASTSDLPPFPHFDGGNTISEVQQVPPATSTLPTPSSR